MDNVPSIKRRLAAILAADIAGYSRLMGEDEAATVRDLKGRQAVVLPLIAQHGGRIIDTAGDGILAEFPSVVGATECAVEIQTVMAARNEAAPEPRRMQYRIGINLGDVIHDESRIYGDGINVAARLEGIAEPGGICISRQVFEHVNRAVKADFQALGLRSLKNIAQPVDVFAIAPRRGARPGEADRTVDDISFDAFVGDLEAVADAAQVPRFVLFGVSQGCAVAVAYAVRHPERVSHLVLYGGYALGVNRRSRTAAQKDEDAAMLTLMRLGWGKENPAFRQLFTSQFMPGATKEQADWFNELQRVSVSPEIAARITETNGETDVTALLPRVSVPTLVMHARDDARVPFDAGRRLAAGIPGARFVPLQGRNHLFLETEPAFGQFLEHTRAFLAG